MGPHCQFDAVVGLQGVPLLGCHPDFGLPVAKGGQSS
jgi:hypothetical protein